MRYLPSALGWLPDLPDLRDYSVDCEAVQRLLAKLRRPRPARGGRPQALSWEEFLPAVEDQLAMRSCTAHACAALVEYFERRTAGRAFTGSSRFLYRMARRLLDWPGDAGATLRANMKALRRFGLPPREYWADANGGCDAEPAAFLFSFAREFDPLTYVRLGTRGGDGQQTLTAVKAFLAAGLPVAFGFTVFDSVTEEADVSFPSCFDRPLGGQAVLAIGYNDARRVRSEKGALRVRNSWGSAWGDGGYGWLPYRYVLEYLAADFWTILRPDWLACGEIASPI